MTGLTDRRGTRDRRSGDRRAIRTRLPHDGRAIGTASAAVVLALAGAGCLGFVATNQTHFPQPALSSPGAVLPASLSDGVVGPTMAASRPTAISIPSIKVQSPVIELGLTTGNEVQVPVPGPDYDHAGWYKYSPTPGELGPALIVGHIDSAADGPSVFFELGALHAKDVVRVDRADGTTAVFSVDKVMRFKKSEFPTQLVYGDIDHAGLRLVTCGGPFDNASGHYRDNIIVFASLVSGE